MTTKYELLGNDLSYFAPLSNENGYSLHCCQYGLWHSRRQTYKK